MECFDALLRVQGDFALGFWQTNGCIRDQLLHTVVVVARDPLLDSHSLWAMLVFVKVLHDDLRVFALLGVSRIDEAARRVELRGDGVGEVTPGEHNPGHNTLEHGRDDEADGGLVVAGDNHHVGGRVVPLHLARHHVAHRRLHHDEPLPVGVLRVLGHDRAVAPRNLQLQAHNDVAVGGVDGLDVHHSAAEVVAQQRGLLHRARLDTGRCAVGRGGGGGGGGVGGGGRLGGRRRGLGAR
mmetsp:Transcript_14825/g.34795  ORF Transcript_14825/g.34795 Transcript_14825/m.34795 type:complete len:239 (+) Transcript_14825:565-1281(+)